MDIAIDFDGTLHKGIRDDFPNIGEPRQWLIDQAIGWRKEGHKLILWTCREDVYKSDYTLFPPKMYLTEAVEWCKSYNLDFDAVNKNLIEVKYPNIKACRKIHADIYIDDRSVIFNDSDGLIGANHNDLSSINIFQIQPNIL